MGENSANRIRRNKRRQRGRYITGRRRLSSTSSGRGGDREGDTHLGEEGIHSQAQVKEETEREIHIREKRAFIHKLR